MKKVLILGLFIITFSLVQVSAETWPQLIRRAERMQENVRLGISIGNQNTWSIDKWGALLASYTWLEFTFGQIYTDAPNLAAEERRIWGNMYRRRIEMSIEIQRLLNLTHGRSPNTINRIYAREEHWLEHLIDGGIIRFN
jgi:hypothetical protein